VRYSSAAGVDALSLGDRNLRAIGRGFQQNARLVESMIDADGGIAAVYEIALPANGVAGDFRIELLGKSVRNKLGRNVLRAHALAFFSNLPQ
jgi:hypothetical protein